MSSSRTVRSLVAAALASGALLAGTALPAVADSHHDRHRAARSTVEIGEVHHEGAGRAARSNRRLNAEWVEVANTGRRAVDLRNWTLTDEEGNRYRFGRLRLAGGAKVRVHTGAGRDTARDVFQGKREQVWDRRDSATLRDSRGRVVDTESWGRSGHRR
ncbi:lamin tail domain-containing protein [Streptomyces sp. NPDC006879]|uniref:lamin tail domain-containing protein n=1 Tax=Streptomyces sp. NPDC006879 TaxID=3364767 RepID=UPI003681B6CC